MFVKDVNPKTYCGCKEDNRYFLKENMLSELVTDYQKEQAKKNLGIDSLGNEISNIFRSIEYNKDTYTLIFSYIDNIEIKEVKVKYQGDIDILYDTSENKEYTISNEGLKEHSWINFKIETNYKQDNDDKVDISYYLVPNRILAITDFKQEESNLVIDYIYKNSKGEIKSDSYKIDINFTKVNNIPLYIIGSSSVDSLIINKYGDKIDLLYNVVNLDAGEEESKILSLPSATLTSAGLLSGHYSGILNELDNGRIIYDHNIDELINFRQEPNSVKLLYNSLLLNGGNTITDTSLKDIPVANSSGAGIITSDIYNTFDEIQLLLRDGEGEIISSGNPFDSEITDNEFIINYSYKNLDGGGEGDITIPLVTDTKAGLMSPNQYDNLSILENNILNNILVGGNDVNLISGELTENGYKITVPQLRPNDYNPDEQQYEDITIPNVTGSSNGLMLSNDKTKLDKLIFGKNNKISVLNLPSYVDDVVDIYAIVDNDSNFPDTSNLEEGTKLICLENGSTPTILDIHGGQWATTTGEVVESDKIYVLTSNNSNGTGVLFDVTNAKENTTWRWSGTKMVQISSSLVIGEVTGTAFDGGKGKAIEDWRNRFTSSMEFSRLTSISKDTTSVGLKYYNYNANTLNPTQEYTLIIPAATDTTAGVMSSSDKTKLDNISSTFISQLANRQILSFTKGVIAQQNANQVNINAGTVSVNNEGVWSFGNDGDNDIVIKAATETVMSATDKAKLDTIEENANNYTLPTASVMDLGGIKSGAEPSYNLSQEYTGYIDNYGTINIKIPLVNATSGGMSQNQGLLSLTDYNSFKAKQDALVSGTNIKTINNQSILGSGNIEITSSSSIPEATTTVSGAVKVSNNITDFDSSSTPYPFGYQKLPTVLENGQVKAIVGNVYSGGNGLMSAEDKSKLDKITAPSINNLSETQISDNSTNTLKLIVNKLNELMDILHAEGIITKENQ